MEKKPTYAELEQRVRELEKDFRRRERLEEELLAARRQFEDIIQSLPDPTFVIACSHVCDCLLRDGGWWRRMAG